MDILGSSKIEVTALALEGLAARHKAISSNIANADSPGYKRVDVNFENQLKRIIETDHAKETRKVQRSAGLNVSISPENAKSFMNYSEFKPTILHSQDGSVNENGNNINIEKEMAELTKNGMKYNALASIQAKNFRGLSEIIKGGSV